MKYLSQYNSLFFLTHPVHAAVTPDEFPDTATVRRKVDDFERQFVAVFVDAFQCLAPLNQLAAVSVATRPDRANQAVSLLQYLASPADGPARRHATRPSRCSSTSSCSSTSRRLLMDPRDATQPGRLVAPVPRVAC